MRVHFPRHCDWPIQKYPSLETRTVRAEGPMPSLKWVMMQKETLHHGYQRRHDANLVISVIMPVKGIGR